MTRKDPTLTSGSPARKGRYYHPTSRMIAAAITTIGFPTPRAVRGGFLTTRIHPDGRLQALSVFSWSNYAAATADGTPGCNLCLRVSLSLDPSLLDGPDDALVTRAWCGVPTTLWFERDSWLEVAPTLQARWQPVLDAPHSEADTALLALADLTVPHDITRSRIEHHR